MNSQKNKCSLKNTFSSNQFYFNTHIPIMHILQKTIYRNAAICNLQKKKMKKY